MKTSSPIKVLVNYFFYGFAGTKSVDCLAEFENNLNFSSFAFTSTTKLNIAPV